MSPQWPAYCSMEVVTEEARHRCSTARWASPKRWQPGLCAALSQPLRSDRLSMASQLTPKAHTSASRRPTLQLYFANTRAFWNIRNHGVLPSQAFGQNEPATPVIVRSGCGIRMVTRPSVLVTEAIPAGEPFGFAG